MAMFYSQAAKAITVIATAFLLFSCASTKLTEIWVDPNYKKSYNNLLIIGIVESQQNRRVYESNFVEALKALGVSATASYTLIKSSEKIDRNSITKAIKGMDIDGVIVTYMISVDEETVYRPGTTYITGGGYGYGGYGGYPYTYTQTPGYYTTHETYVLENNLYDVASEELVWSARSRSFSPQSVQEVVTDLTKLIIADLQEKHLLRKK
ncbi:MAG: hypothetical protein RQ982_02965 [Gammaproteobacteria bacterium]|nr:hypothetical protein [Gammaproteobacteria bacterium]